MEKETKKSKEELKEVVKEVVKEENKSHIWLITVLVICLMAVCGGFGWLAGASFAAFSPKDKAAEAEKEDKPVEPTEKHLTEAEVSSYTEKMQWFISNWGRELPLKLSDLSNNDVLYYSSLRTKNVESFSKNELANVIADYFGKDFEYSLKDINCFVNDGVWLKYDEATGMFSRVGNHGHGGPGGVRAKEYFVDAIEKGDTLEIKVKVLYGGYCGDICGPVTDYYAKAPFENSIYEVKTECYSQSNNCDDYDSVYPQVKDQLPITTFVYKKQSDGKFGLREIH